MKIFSRLARADDQKADSNGRVNAVFASPNLALDDHLLLPGCFVKSWKGQGETGLTYYQNIECPLLRAHNISENSVGRVANLRETLDGKLVGTAIFAPTTAGQELATLYEFGFQSSFSISWLPVEYSYSKDKTRGPGAIDFKRVKLLEISCVTIPSDMSATVQRKAQEGDVKGAAIALGVNLAIKEIEPHVAEVAIREASRMLSEDFFVRSVAERATFFAVADDTFRKLSKIMK